MPYSIPGSPSSGIIKSVQRGVVNGASGATNITISAVNPDKCAVTISGGNVAANVNAGYANYFARITGLTSTVLTINDGYATSGYGNVSMQYGWQIVEYS